MIPGHWNKCSGKAFVNRDKSEDLPMTSMVPKTSEVEVSETKWLFNFNIFFMNFFSFRFALLAIVLPCVLLSCKKDEEEPYDVMIDFQNVVIPNAGYNNDAGASGFFKEGIVSFQNTNAIDEEWDYPYWYGFAYSKQHDTETPGWENQFSAYVVNDEKDNQFMVGYIDTYYGKPTIEINFERPVKDLSFDVANTTYAALAMKNGFPPAKKFTESDWFKLTIKVTSTDGTETITINLGEGAKITNVWNTIPVQTGNITRLEFSLTSSDTGAFGMNTPAYFCIDNIKARTVK